MKKIILLLLYAAVVQAHEGYFLESLRSYISIDEDRFQRLLSLADQSAPRGTILDERPLCMTSYFPGLKTISHIALAELPTPVHYLSNLSLLLHTDFFIKRDDLAGRCTSNACRSYGGNKLRKLEILLADALKHNAKTILTFGCVGSNHAVATAFYARCLGLTSISMLMPETNSHDVRTNLLRMAKADSIMIHSSSPHERARKTVDVIEQHKLTHGDYPYVIPTGGSCPLGIIGFVNAAFELKEQIDAGLIPKPDYIYIPYGCGSGGSTAGLLLGLKAAQLDSKLVAVSVEPCYKEEQLKKMLEKARATNLILTHYDPTFPVVDLSERDLEFVTNFCGPRYAVFTSEGMAAKKLMKELESIDLDGVYGAKAMACVLAHARQGKFKNKKLLFWHTFCGSCDLDAQSFDYARLPQPLQNYFTTEVQSLDVN